MKEYTERLRELDPVIGYVHKKPLWIRLPYQPLWGKRRLPQPRGGLTPILMRIGSFPAETLGRSHNRAKQHCICGFCLQMTLLHKPQAFRRQNSHYP